MGADNADYPPDAVSLWGLVSTHVKDITGLGAPNSLKLLPVLPLLLLRLGGRGEKGEPERGEGVGSPYTP